jgi:phosphoribosylformimino-5-aminoimidazole carboxamide ribotide isomerase
MILFPAIDLKEGRCVRLRQGDLAHSTVFNEDPTAQAEIFARAGFDWLHIVDLDGAFAGRPGNRVAIEAVLGRVRIPVQLGGGIRDLATVEAWLSRGVRRVILGTAAVRDPAFVKTAAKKFPDRVAVGIDARDGRVAVEGWSQTSKFEAAALARRFEDSGVCALIHTDIARDGMLSGLNLDATLALARAVDIPVIAAGGLSSMVDIEHLTEPRCALLGGAIAGRALYDGRIDAKRALAMLKADKAQAGARAVH